MSRALIYKSAIKFSSSNSGMHLKARVCICTELKSLSHEVLCLGILAKVTSFVKCLIKLQNATFSM